MITADNETKNENQEQVENQPQGDPTQTHNAEPLTEEEQEKLDNEQAQEIVAAAISTQNNDLATIMVGAEGHLILLQDEEITRNKLKELVELNKNEVAELIAVPQQNPTQLKRTTLLRAVYRNCRLMLEKIPTHNTKVLNAAKDKNKEAIAGLVAEVKPTEDVLAEKIKKEKDRKAEERRVAEEKETERKRAINQKITDAGIEFNRLILIGKTQDDLDEFDRLYKEFEDNLESLQEFEFEGNQLLERIAPKRSDIFDRVEDARLQAEKDIELQQKDEELSGKQDKIDQKAKDLEIRERNLARKELIADMGLVKEPTGFSKNGAVYPFIKDGEPVDYLQASDADFDNYIAGINKVETAKARLQQKLTDNKTEYLLLVAEYKEFVGVDLDTTLETVTDEILAKTKQDIEDGKTEQAQAAERTRKEAIQTAGKPVYDLIVKSAEELTEKLNASPTENAAVNSVVQDYLSAVKRLNESIKSDFYL